jgi:hypothetical protein
MAPTQKIFESLREALEWRDADAMLALYDEDAVIIGFDKLDRSLSPLRLDGKGEIEPVVRDLFTRDVHCEVSDRAVSDDRFSFIELCEHPDGVRIHAATLCELREDRIVREVQVPRVGELRIPIRPVGVVGALWDIVTAPPRAAGRLFAGGLARERAGRQIEHRAAGSM